MWRRFGAHWTKGNEGGCWRKLGGGWRKYWRAGLPAASRPLGLPERLRADSATAARLFRSSAAATEEEEEEEEDFFHRNAYKAAAS